MLALTSDNAILKRSGVNYLLHAVDAGDGLVAWTTGTQICVLLCDVRASAKGAGIGDGFAMNSKEELWLTEDFINVTFLCWSPPQRSTTTRYLAVGSSNGVSIWKIQKTRDQLKASLQIKQLEAQESQVVLKGVSWRPLTASDSESSSPLDTLHLAIATQSSVRIYELQAAEDNMAVSLWKSLAPSAKESLVNFCWGARGEEILLCCRGEITVFKFGEEDTVHNMLVADMSGQAKASHSSGSQPVAASFRSVTALGQSLYVTTLEESFLSVSSEMTTNSSFLKGSQLSTSVSSLSEDSNVIDLRGRFHMGLLSNSQAGPNLSLLQLPQQSQAPPSRITLISTAGRSPSAGGPREGKEALSSNICMHTLDSCSLPLAGSPDLVAYDNASRKLVVASHSSTKYLMYSIKEDDSCDGNLRQVSQMELPAQHLRIKGLAFIPTLDHQPSKLLALLADKGSSKSIFSSTQKPVSLYLGWLELPALFSAQAEAEESHKRNREVNLTQFFALPQAAKSTEPYPKVPVKREEETSDLNRRLSMLEGLSKAEMQRKILEAAKLRKIKSRGAVHKSHGEEATILLKVTKPSPLAKEQPFSSQTRLEPDFGGDLLQLMTNLTATFSNFQSSVDNRLQSIEKTLQTHSAILNRLESKVCEPGREKSQ